MMTLRAVSAMTVDFLDKIPAVQFVAGEIKAIADDEAALMAVFNYHGTLRLLQPHLTAEGVELQDITDKILPLLRGMQQAILENDTAAYCEMCLWAKQVLGVPMPEQDAATLAAQFPPGKTLMGNLIDLLYRSDNDNEVPNGL